jgi:hypothetical protein
MRRQKRRQKQRKKYVMKSQENPLNRPESTTPIYVVGTAGNLPIPASPAPETGAKKGFIRKDGVWAGKVVVV